VDGARGGGGVEGLWVLVGVLFDVCCGRGGGCVCGFGVVGSRVLLRVGVWMKAGVRA